MNERETMKLALEALEQHGTPLLNHEDAYSASLNALRQAIAAAKKQEPVAWSYTNAQGRDVIIRGNVAPDEAPYEDATPLYAHPQPKREWVGLTDEEAAECWNSSAVTTWKNIEAKLREKNGC